VTTTNPIYRCEELEQDRISLYDTIIEENVCNAYMEVLSDEAHQHDQGNRPQLPKPREETEYENRGHDYEGLKDKTPENVYLHLVNDETQPCDQRTNAGDQDTDEVQDQDNKTDDRHQDVDSKPREQLERDDEDQNSGVMTERLHQHQGAEAQDGDSKVHEQGQVPTDRDPDEGMQDHGQDQPVQIYFQMSRDDDQSTEA